MKKAGWIVFCLFITSFLMSQNDLDQFDRGIVYYLINDTQLAKGYLESFFFNKSSYQLRNGFFLLLDGKYWEATKEFKDFLDINHRSQVGLVGIALSTVDMKNTATVENLERTIRLNPRFPSAYACLGVEYRKKRDFPRAEGYFKQSLRYSRTPEFKILLADLYLSMDKPEMALQLIQNEADQNPKNFYFNLLTARSLLKLKQMDSIGTYITRAQEVKPQSPDAKLLRVQYLIARQEYSQARSLMNSFKFESYNEDYVKTFGRLLLELKDRKAFSYLYELFSKKEWDVDINRLMGLYFLNQPKKSNIQNWISRSILSGNSIEKLKQLFPDRYRFPEYPVLPFFNVKKVKWISDNIILIIATQKSGDRERLFFIDAEKMKIMNSLNYQGDFQDFFMSENSKNIIFSTVAISNERVYLYVLSGSGYRFSLKPALKGSLKMASVLVGFNKQGDQAFITDQSITSLAFESPFSSVSLYGQKKLVYPVYPFPIFRYDFTTGRLSQLKVNNRMDQLEMIPIPDIKRYTLVCRAFQNHSQIGDLIQKGRHLDLTSSQVIKIHFNRDSSAFIIYLSDLKNAFQALAYDEFRNRVDRIDGTMFLGKDRYATVEICDFNPRGKEILVLTKDKIRSLIEFNYGSFLYRLLGESVIDLCVNPDDRMVVLLTERSDNVFYQDTNLELISLHPFIKTRITSRRDLNRIRKCQQVDQIWFNTNYGERVMMDDQSEFHYQGVSLEGAIHDSSPDGKKVAAFINGGFFVFDWKL